MKEDTQVRQIPGERKRRWFSSADFDLIVWLNENNSIAGFELCYNKQVTEHSFVWRSANGFSHMAIDDGEQRPGKYKASPVHVADGFFDAKRVHSDFSKESSSLPNEIAECVLNALKNHPNYAAAP